MCYHYSPEERDHTTALAKEQRENYDSAKTIYASKVTSTPKNQYGTSLFELI